MAKIDIKYSSGKLESTSGLPEVEPMDLSGIMQVSADIARDSIKQHQERKRLEQLATDSNYNADAIVKMNAEVQRVKDTHKDLLYTDPDGYARNVTTELQPALQGFIDNAPSAQSKASIQDQAARMRVHTGMSVQNDASEARISMYIATFDENMDAISAKVYNDPSKLGEAKVERLAMLEGLRTIVDPKEYEARAAASSERLDRTFLVGAAERSPEEAIKAIKSGTFDHLGAEDLTKIEYTAHQEINTRIMEREKELEVARQDVVLDIKSRLAKSRDLRSANSLVDEVLSRQDELGKDLPQVLNDAYSNYDGWKAKQEDVVRVATYIESGVHLEPGNKKDEKAADVAFDPFRDKYNKAEPQEKTAMISAWLDRVGVLPPSVEKGLFDALKHGQPKAKVQAAITINQLLDQDERLMRQFAGRNQDIAIASKVALNIQYGMSEVDAVTSAEKDVFEGSSTQSIQDPRRKARAILYEKNKEPIVLGDFTKAFRDDPDELNPEMVGEAEDLKRQLVLNFGVPEDKAHARSVALTQARWGVTEINGEKEFTRNPAEKVYGGKGDTSWIKQQFHKEVTAVGVLPNRKKIDPEGLIAKPLPDFLNKRSTPVYTVMYDDGTGVPQPVLKKDNKGNLTPFVWRPSISTSDKAAASNSLTKSKLDKLNTEANLSATYRYRNKVLTNALSREDLPDELKGRIRKELLPIAPKDGIIPKGISDKEFNDIAPVKLGPKTGKNLKIGNP